MLFMGHQSLGGSRSLVELKTKV